MGNMYKDIPTNSTGVRVHITGYAGDERTGCTLRGYAIDGRGIRIDGSKTLRRTAGTAADIPTAEQHLVAAVVNALPIKPTASHVSPHRKKLDQNHPMVQAFEALCNGNFKVSVSWNASVEKRYLSCRHGVTGELHAREMLPDGQKRRASPKRRTN